MKKLLIILFSIMSWSTVSVGQNLFLKGKFFYIPTSATLYGVALEKEFNNLWSVELGLSGSIFDDTRDDGPLDKSTFITLEARKGFQTDEKAVFFLTAYTGFAHLVNEFNVEDPRNSTNVANGGLLGLGAGLKIFFSPKFGMEFSLGPRYFFSFEDNSEMVKQLKYGNFSWRIGFNFFWLFNTD